MMLQPIHEISRSGCLLADDSLAAVVDSLNEVVSMLTPTAKAVGAEEELSFGWSSCSTASTRAPSKESRLAPSESEVESWGSEWTLDQDEVDMPLPSPVLVAREETMIFVDWDDTLFPTSWLDSKPLFKAWWKGLATVDEVLSEGEWLEVQALDRAAASLLTAASRHGKVCCVTLAQPNWHLRTMQAFLPLVAAAWEQLAIETHYAFSEKATKDLVSSGGWTSSVEDSLEHEQMQCQLRMRQKQRSMTKALRKFYGRSGAWKHALSVGDGVFEREALQEIGFKRAACNDGTPFRVKTVKLLDDPTCAEMCDALQDLQATLTVMTYWPMDFDLDMSNVGESLVVEPQQCLLQASL